MSNTILLPFQPDSMTPAQLAAVSYLARYSGHTHGLYAYQPRRRPVCATATGARTGSVPGSAGTNSIRHPADPGPDPLRGKVRVKP